MSLRDKVWDAAKWKLMKAHLGYTDEEMKLFRENPRNEDVLSQSLWSDGSWETSRKR